jgi:hypothetical protein
MTKETALPLDFDLDPFDGAEEPAEDQEPCAQCGRRERGGLWLPQRVCSNCYLGPDKHWREDERAD